MKKIIISSLTLIAACIISACDEDRLEVTQKSASNTADFYGDPSNAQSATSAMYATYIEEIGGNSGIYSPYITGINYTSDDIFAAGGNTDDHADFRIHNEFRYDASAKCVGELYNQIYKCIYSANLVIDNFKGYETPATKKAIAEAKVMRAWAHMLAAQVYYQPPIVDHLLTNEIPENAPSQKAIFDFCIKDCEEAMNDLPERNGSGDKDGSFVVTKGFAQFVAGKAALFAGDNKKVISVMKPLVESPNYALVPGERFRDLFHVEGDGCEEKIFEFNFTANKSLPGAAAEWDSGLKRGHWMVNNVLNWRGDDIPDGGMNPQICACGGWGGGSINHEFAHKMLENDGDSYRRKATFLTSEEFLYDETLCPWLDDKKDDGSYGALTREQKEFDPHRGIKPDKKTYSFSRSDVMEVKKMMHPNDCDLSVSNTCNNTNLCIARLAEAYLIYAEACIAEGDNGEAKKYINKIQERAGSKTISTEVNLQVLQDEKQYELWFEGCRWFDIVRWGIAKQCYDKVLDNIPMQYDEYWQSGGTKPHKLGYVVQHPFKEIGITLEFVEGKHEYWPIPQSIIDVNTSIHQVRGWQ